MMKKRLSAVSDPYFDVAWGVYLNSFPEEERRPIAVQQEVMDNPLYHFEIVTLDKLFLGFLLWWNFEDLRYIEHFAILPDQRGKGYGKQILDRFLRNENSSVLLEVELPESEIQHRRIRFYQNMGFKLNEHFYQQPPYAEGGT